MVLGPLDGLVHVGHEGSLALSGHVDSVGHEDSLALLDHADSVAHVGSEDRAVDLGKLGMMGNLDTMDKKDN